ncbi:MULTISPECIES: UDP-N-acetylglucosamine--N-acetylmuramyl-(pentapeptide) pyrophosphoryl-undecaprenol N-acetylglucosamine transferase [unclassified Bifidobacterium]|uniref:UDP-N-acetylglucosamine--N-acetylmuramyl- (pentapeptide) pyrophosphoryl-undecaprenol N-acetylglucosamine transferase n=1 Tax=unclassified Bifidobacterium TaxID=2608897 RepID=UPI0023F8FE5D|nr:MULTISPECIES: UDP-N-acetylglucosamine--N-acetylmuramyl-(pentapeptide) pyrophosphoryl-undecaprenol N-acetylglucosamine transferase [unclassified Bifidobacterium]WEV66253.1 UDP-N-acetylglucosamine--N-acetylmuramyl-(pentapeptide) pyrophosphoryl-undecaprenol N-acetylglucosamine transferase [Bifidobacterium sp. ESL0764]WEV74961.1 UDP-N-acetylglucosamine--N-acetylmuramyl-(pentapeptide) pyrophosphoryl-undecaprenol N-acetylglucosamine transferase [Bifidobacterium sp. ESL0800]
MKHIVLAGGGTAGHVNPLLSVASAIKRDDPQAAISVIGTDVGLERDLVPQAGFELDTIAKVPFPRRLDMQALRFPGRWRREQKKVRSILEARKADVVVGFGGYVSAPVYSVAHSMGLPIVIHEQNASAGMANKLGARWADFIGTAYENAGLKAHGNTEIRRVGLPLRPVMAELCQKLGDDRQRTRKLAAAQLGIDPTRPLVVVTGGSLGAVSLNEAVSGAAADLLKVTQVIHLTGRNKSAEVGQRVKATVGEQALTDLDPAHAGRGDYHMAQYLERIDLAFAAADLVICRAGAGTTSELAAIGMPAVYVPLPIGNGEQRFNAQPVVDAGGGLMVADGDFTSSWVREHVPSLIAERERLQSMGRKAYDYGIRDAAETMAGIVLDYAGRNR